MNKLIVLGGYFETGLESEFVNMIISISRWNIWKRRCTIRYENIFVDIEKSKNDIFQEIYNHCKMLKRTCKQELASLIDNIM